IGIIAILKSGAAYLPIDPESPPDRITYMLKDSNASIKLTATGNQHETENHGDSKHRAKGPEDGEDIDIVTAILKNTDAEEKQLDSVENQSPIVNEKENRGTSRTIAYIIYTSGTTGKPKGVPVTHDSVINLAYTQKKRYGIRESDRVLQFSSLSFDASVEQVYITLLSGAHLALIDKETLLEANTFEAYIAANGITHLNAVPAFLESINLEKAYHIKRIIAGGDSCPPSLAQKWLRHPQCRFYNVYGPTETTVTSIVAQIEEKDANGTALPIGKPIGNTTVYLMDKNMRLVPQGAAGELYIGGAGVAPGYLNRPQLTSEKFVPNPYDNKEAPPITQSPHSLPNNQLYRTGDLARWRKDGNLEFLGRIDYQVKIRGFRIELGEIENQLLTHKDLKEAVVVAKTDKGNAKYLCAYVVLKPDRQEVQLKLSNYLSQTLPGYMIPAYFVQLEKIPLTPNGKVDRKTLPEPEIETGKTDDTPRNEREKRLTAIWAEVLDMPADAVGIDANFFEQGGHSLKAAVLAAKIHKTFQTEIPLKMIFNTPTIRGIATYIKSSAKIEHIALEPAKKKDHYSMSPSQRQLYIMQQMNTGSTHYNIPSIARLEGQLDPEKLENAFKTVIRNHESLRTSFQTIDDKPYQKVHEHVEFKVEYRNVEAPYDAEALISQYIRPFDLARAPLLRVAIIREEEQRHIMVVDMHHIITDGTSIGIMVKEFMTVYDGEDPQPNRNQYKDYSEWQATPEVKERVQKQEDYWLEQYRGEQPVLNLPYDFTRPATLTFEGGNYAFREEEEQTAALMKLAQEEEVTLFMIVLSAYNILLSRLSGQEDIVVGTPIANRRHADLQNIIGMFVNTLPIRSKPISEKTFSQYLAEVKEQTLQSYENQEYPFEEIVHRLGAGGDASRNPVFDVLFVFQNTDIPELEIPGLKLSPYSYDIGISVFDLIMIGHEDKGKLKLEYLYNKALFKHETIQRYSEYLKEIIDTVLENKNIVIKDITISSGLVEPEAAFLEEADGDFDF
ncbi:MAG: amino acid adenylation domain-containing protein, partial [bacterium]|nr:amino acid adenylation domain-containing protein [bacterium]